MESDDRVSGRDAALHFPKTNQTATIFSFSALSAATYVLTRAFGVSLFLVRMGSDALPLALAASAITVIVISLVTRISIRFVPTRLGIAISWMGLAGVSLFLSANLDPLQHSLIIVGMLYVLAEVRGCLNSIYVTTLSNDAFARSPSKQPYALVAAGPPIAGIIAGIFLSIEVSEINYATWLKIIAGIDICVVLLSVFLPKITSKRTAQKSEASEKMPASSGLQTRTRMEKIFVRVSHNGGSESGCTHFAWLSMEARRCGLHLK